MENRVNIPKVLMIASLGPPPFVGGIENVVDTLRQSELSNKYDISIFDTFREEDPNRGYLDKYLFATKLALGFFFYIRRTRPSIVHFHFCSNVDFWKYSICLVISTLFKAKVVSQLHGGNFISFFERQHYLIKVLIKYCFRIPDRVIALSAFWSIFLETIVEKEKIHIIHNPIDCEKYTPKNQMDVRCKEQLVLLGRIGRLKGHYDVVKALEIVKNLYPNIVVIFVGNEAEPGAIKKLKIIAERKDLISNIKFTGVLVGVDKIRLLQESTLMVLPSYKENMPLSVIEGMAAQLPVISSDVGALPEMLGCGTRGLLVEAGNYEQLASSIVQLLSDPELSRKLAKRAYDKVVEECDISKITSCFSSIYNELLE